MNLHEIMLFDDLTQDELDRILHCAKAKYLTFSAGETIICPGDEPTLLYLVVEGEVVLEQSNYMGKLMQVEYRHPGDLFGHEDVFLGKNSFDYTVRATKPAKIMSAQRSFFYCPCEKSCAHHHQITYNLLHIFAQESDEKQKRLKLLTCGELEQRVATYLLSLDEKRKTVELPMKRDELAIYLNATRPSLSRALSNLQGKDIIKLDGRKKIHILDSESLQEISDGL